MRLAGRVSKPAVDVSTHAVGISRSAVSVSVSAGAIPHFAGSLSRFAGCVLKCAEDFSQTALTIMRSAFEINYFTALTSKHCRQDFFRGCQDFIRWLQYSAQAFRISPAGVRISFADIRISFPEHPRKTKDRVLPVFIGILWMSSPANDRNHLSRFLRDQVH